MEQPQTPDELCQLEADVDDLIAKFHPTLRQEQWPVGESAALWFFGRSVPPLAFTTRWTGCKQTLSPEQQQWFRSRQAFAWIEDYPDFSSAKCPEVPHLFVHDLQLRCRPTALVHATPVGLIERILSEGLKPGRVTGVHTTRRSPHAIQWVHLLESVEQTTAWLLNKTDYPDRIPTGEYGIIAVDPSGIPEIFCDPFYKVAYVTETSVAPEFLRDEGSRILVPES